MTILSGADDKRMTLRYAGVCRYDERCSRVSRTN